ncbi:MAG: hypothetical protein M3M96_01990 [Candidatus Eremiobacteraeota bacterium]|nr:hypothetical protein [Candidatus Eremiobacteraeota bacterium]
MHATLPDLADERPEHRSRALRARAVVPYCFILDDAYHVIMAGPSSGADPLAELYQAESGIDTLPGPVDRVVRALTATWRVTRTVNNASAAVNNLQVTVAPLHGTDGRRIAVFVQPLPM